jgi:sec-independent protein translocase protein TatA
MGALQPWHIIVLLIVVLLVFGAGKLPDVGKSLGKSIKEFKEEVGTGGDSKAASSTLVANSNTVSTASNEEPEVVVKRTTRTLEDGTTETVEEHITRKKVVS